MNGGIVIGCAGWSVPGAAAAAFPEQGSHLERYSAVFNGVEINTSFYRPHRPATYARWRDSVPEDFRFSVKLPRAITHYARLRDSEEPLLRFLDEAGNLGHKLGCLLVQLPPSLAYDAEAAPRFFALLRAQVEAPIACEPRHASWAGADAADMLAKAGIAYVDADPAVIDTRHAAEQDFLYVRLHGSPVMYRSAYSDSWLDALSARLVSAAQAGKQAWCIFDNTADGAAVPNALSLKARVGDAALNPR
jgi:uncharacterized protein YecE (DUF72 family)